MQRINNKIIIALLAVMTLNVMMTTACAQDFILLELLIKNHKERSNKLKSRSVLRTEGYGTTVIEKNKTEAYEDVLDKLSNRMGGLMSYAAFAADVYVLEQLAEEVVHLEGKATQITGEALLFDQSLVNVGLNIQNEFSKMIGRITKRCIYLVSSGLGVTMATQEQRKQFTDQTGEDLRQMRNILRNYIQFGTMRKTVSPAKNGNNEESRHRFMEAVESFRQKSFENTLRLIENKTDIFKLGNKS